MHVNIHIGYVGNVPEPTVTLSLVPTMWEFSAFSWSHKVGAIDLNQIRVEWVFTGVLPTSLHIELTIIHKWLCSADRTKIVKQDIFDNTALCSWCKRVCWQIEWLAFDIHFTGSPGCLLPLHLLSVHCQQLIQLGEELRRRRAIILLPQDKPDPLRWRNCGKKEAS